MATSEKEAHRKVVEARQALGAELDQFTATTRSAVDIPAKVRKHPLETAAVAGGAGFLLLGGPKRVIKAVRNRIRPQRPHPHHGLLPKDVEKVVKQHGGGRSDEIEAALEADFASYLQEKAKKPPANAEQSFWKTYDTLVGPLGALAVQQLISRLFKPEKSGQTGTDPAAAAAGVVGSAQAGPTAMAAGALTAVQAGKVDTKTDEASGTGRTEAQRRGQDRRRDR